MNLEMYSGYPELKMSDIVTGTKIVLLDDVFKGNPPLHAGVRFIEAIITNEKYPFIRMKVLGSDGENALHKGTHIDRTVPTIMMRGRLMESAAPKENHFKDGGEINPDNPEVKEYFAHQDGKAGGVLVGKRHSEGGIQGVNKATGDKIEVEGGEVIITRGAVQDDSLHDFEGEKLTNKQILSKINVSGGGVAFAEGGDIPDLSCRCTGKKYQYGGTEMSDYDIIRKLGAHYEPSESEIERGAIIELREHGKDLDRFREGDYSQLTLARQMAITHLKENPDYYSK